VAHIGCLMGGKLPIKHGNPGLLYQRIWKYNKTLKYTDRQAIGLGTAGRFLVDSFSWRNPPTKLLSQKTLFSHKISQQRHQRKRQSCLYHASRTPLPVPSLSLPLYRSEISVPFKSFFLLLRNRFGHKKKREGFPISYLRFVR